MRVNYIFLCALKEMQAIKAKGSALHGKKFFRTGVMVPFIASDNYTPTVARNDQWKLRSVAAGFLECKDNTDLLEYLIPKTAFKEADEEFGVSSKGKRRINYIQVPQIESISFRTIINKRGASSSTIEFITPIPVKQHSSQLSKLMNNNTAAHAHEHIPNTVISIPLDPNDRQIATDFMQRKLPGNFLYGPVLHACANHTNKVDPMSIAPHIQGIPNCRFYPMRFFQPTPTKALTDHSTIPQSFEEKSERNNELGHKYNYSNLTISDSPKVFDLRIY